MNKPRELALITGASLGIGFEIAKLLRAKDYDLILVSRSQERLERARDLIKGEGAGSVEIITCDLASPSGAEELYEHCRRNGVAIDLLVNNAGFGMIGEHSEFDPVRVRDMTALNVVALTVLCNLFGHDMKLRRKGLILNVASTAAFQPIPFFGAYSATKSYVLSFSQALAAEMSDYGVGVTCLCPGPTATNFFVEAGLGGETRKDMGLTLMSARQVAEVGLRALFKGRLTVIPGVRNRLRATLGYLTPRRFVVWVLKKFLAKKVIFPKST